MKKMVLWVLLALVSGSLLGKLTFDRYEKIDTESVISYEGYVYLLKYGTYDSLEEMTNSITNLDRYIYIEKDNKLTAYVGIAKTKENINKIKDIYDREGINLLVVKENIDSDEFIQNLTEYEKLLDATEEEKSLLMIQKQIMSCYESVVVEGE